jgi:3-oxocholest-4-en-26-oate---CoA ligase
MRLNVGLNTGPIVEALGDLVPDREAIVWEDRRITYGSLADRARRLARVLQRAGLGARPGGMPVLPWEAGQDIALLFMTNCTEYLEASVAGYLGRVAPANVNYRYTAEEVRYLLNDSSARAVIVHRRFLPVLRQAQHLASACDQLLLVVEDGSDEEFPDGAVPYEHALAAAPEGPIDRGGADDLYVVYTGGTTGYPKGVLWRQEDFLTGPLKASGGSAEILDRAQARGGSLRALPSAPLMHGAAHWNALTTLVGGGTVILQRHPEHLDAADVLDTVERERCSALQIVGDAFARPLITAQRARPRDLTSLRLLVNGGTILSEGLKRQWMDLIPGLRIMDVLGSSEAGQQAIGNTQAKEYRRLGATSILSADRTRELAAGEEEVGWLASGGPIPRGYLGDPGKTAETFVTVGDRRFAVQGDRARLLADGTIELHGRESVTINTGGEKVFAEEVEQAVKTHPDVWDAVVIGRPSERWGNEVVAIVALRDGIETAPTDDELRAACATVIARYKLPKAFIRVGAVQRTASGKPQYGWAREVAQGSAA